MESFEELMAKCHRAVECFVKFRIASKQDAEDVLQEIYLTAYQKFGQLKKSASFKAWLIGIARNKCNDWFREKSRCLEIPLDNVFEKIPVYGRFGKSEQYMVRETLEQLGDKDKQILELYYWKELPQIEIARQLQIPTGTVKSRLHTARQNFKKQYPYHTQYLKGECSMKKLPEILPEYTITRADKEPFPVKWEELMGWCIVPRQGEKLSWGLYDSLSRRRTEYTDMEVVGKAEVHGIEGMEIVAVQHDAEDYYRTGSINEIERRFVAQLTDTHSRYLAESHMENGIRKCYTFLDDNFMNNWGFGEDNCGNETNLSPKGLLVREGNNITGDVKSEILDIVGRYTVTIGGKDYDTICVMDIECFNDAIASEQYLDKNGKTILWRRFNRDDWAFVHYGQKWTEKLPDNERLQINGETYVHWYDCITDYIL
ncbi:MAG: RNA polymerase sigma factor [Lachnospiraceae bacterium]|nr:RNA polymerase sigma factor [Lachnospiraceae bacterium]